LKPSCPNYIDPNVKEGGMQREDRREGKEKMNISHKIKYIEKRKDLKETKKK
jgi:hypothetical protein